MCACACERACVLGVVTQRLRDRLMTHRMQNFANSQTLMKTQIKRWGSFKIRAKAAKSFLGSLSGTPRVPKCPGPPILLIHFESITPLLRISSCHPSAEQSKHQTPGPPENLCPHFSLLFFPIPLQVNYPILPIPCPLLMLGLFFPQSVLPYPLVPHSTFQDVAKMPPPPGRLPEFSHLDLCSPSSEPPGNFVSNCLLGCRQF